MGLGIEIMGETVAFEHQSTLRKKALGLNTKKFLRLAKTNRRTTTRGEHTVIDAPYLRISVASLDVGGIRCRTECRSVLWIMPSPIPKTSELNLARKCCISAFLRSVQVKKGKKCLSLAECCYNDVYSGV